MYKKLLIILVLIISADVNAQCAMCKAVVEGGNETIAEGVNNGITYLMIFPYILVGVLFYFIYKHKKSSKKY
ncbi:hypothetical protein J2Q11_05615 [Tenacibaculum finnmarkense genomovar finnmarkense]|uniref:Uncharacterized protein n=1 Tax=Tenacibaculum finnmarkense genomovar ulcerans TaxID=2781388 RepID=A0A2I2MAH3_9FLAO|nr:hypothetical protein [Tenacibaculum finnmarkense]ALU75806.1 hypothetical protein AUW17_11335 [Tenacibaculum dicentrarchi]MBE7633262.1 hypothetical protein [Tenacibaculum finnmarkense genomovar ulcerans]MBE7644896.1 hypothetical protein [Tenacibaculum finnmarkense genomovar ulcerans]MBE7647059.1 hypothetical protein [Tenacibaculum finnmarkense genomovar ulcerans]MBE7659648.1 hypothetical protein [Tenacibaculum finnmarkense genomovar finnmarkense]